MEALLVVGISALPIAELRAGIPLALSLGFSPASAFLLAILGNILPLPLLLFLLPRVIAFLSGLSGPLGAWVRRYLAWQARHQRLFSRWGPWALFLFVAVPFPGTGLWTGSILSSIFRIPPRRAVLPLVLGVLIAGILVILASLGVFRLFGL